MKILFRSFIAVCLLLAGLWGMEAQLSKTTGATGDKIINFYNWGDFIDPQVLRDFERETGYKVIYETFDSNEAMLTKIRQGGTAYDVIVPSEYIVDAMREEHLLVPLDQTKLPHMKTLNPRFLNMSFDPGNEYSVPYFWGTLGIVYNHELLGEEAISEWEDLWKPEYRNSILMIDGAREVMGIGLQTLGYSLNDTNDDHLIAARDKMVSLMPNIKGLVTDEMKLHMVNGEAAIGVTFSGEASAMLDANEALSYVVPESGSNVWTDNFAIPTSCDNIEGAHALIDYLCRPEVAARNATYVGYATPNLEALKILDPEIVNDRSFYPEEEALDHLEAYENLGKETLIRYNDLFLEIKLTPHNQ